jgi:hypothetical protein
MRGVLLFAFNNDVVNYYDTAVYAAKRINHFLNLPVTLVTDESSLPETPSTVFDNILTVEAQTDNFKTKKTTWINKGRYRAYELSPYDETIVMDTDYVVNSDQLNTVFDLYDDFMCMKYATYLMFNDAPPDLVSKTSFSCAWATVMVFKKTQKAQQIFDSMKMIQENYMHYSNLYSFVPMPYRNDYALAIALHLVNGGIEDTSNYIPWKLVHINERAKVYNTGDELSNEFVVTKQNKRTEYIKIKDTDFHMLDKENFLEIING